MPYTLSVFQNLKKQYPTWNDLYQKLFIEMYGNLRLITFEGNTKYVIIRYEKGKSDFTVPEVPYFRSVVWDTEKNIPVCIAPIKSNVVTESVSIHNVKGPAIAEEYVEGVMLNVFKCKNEDPQLTSRTKLGATTKFYSQRNFNELFTDALLSKNLTLASLSSQFETVEDKDIQIESHFGSFVLQHPEHRIVQDIKVPNLYMVYCGIVEQDGTVTIFDEVDDWSSAHLKSLAIPKYPILGDSETTMEYLNALAHKKDGQWQGLMFRRIGGFDPETRIRLRTFSYINYRNLRGSEANILSRFLRVRQQGLTRDYLFLYPRESHSFNDLELKFRDLTFHIYKLYCSVFKEKSMALKDIQFPIRPILWTLQGIYLNTCRITHRTMKMPLVIQFVNNLPLEQQQELLQYFMGLSKK